MTFWGGATYVLAGVRTIAALVDTLLLKIDMFLHSETLESEGREVRVCSLAPVPVVLGAERAVLLVEIEEALDLTETE